MSELKDYRIYVEVLMNTSEGLTAKDSALWHTREELDRIRPGSRYSGRDTISKVMETTFPSDFLDATSSKTKHLISSPQRSKGRETGDSHAG